MSTVTIESSAIRGKSKSGFRRIVISERNYLALKKLGYAGDSFNDVISKLLRIERIYREMKKQQQEQQQQDNSDNTSSTLSSLSTPSAAFVKQNKQQMAELIQLLQGKSERSIGRNNQTIKQESK